MIWSRPAKTTVRGYDLVDRPPRPYDATSESWREQRGYSTSWENSRHSWSVREAGVLRALAELSARPGVSPYQAALTIFGG